MKESSLKALNNRLTNARVALHSVPRNAEPRVLEDAKNVLQNAQEQLRIFSYKAKPYLSRNGHSLRP